MLGITVLKVVVGVAAVVANPFLFEVVRQASVVCSVDYTVGSASSHCLCSEAIWLSCSVSRHDVEG